MRQVQKTNWRDTHRKTEFGSREVRSRWDYTKTKKQNYEVLGLAGEVNSRHGWKVPSGVVPVEFQSVLDDQGLHQNLQAAPPNASRKGLHNMTEDERQYLQRLVKKYGDDHARMARDLSLNYKQHSKERLKRRCERLHKLESAEEDADT